MYYLWIACCIDISEEDNSLSSPPPASPQNTKRIDSYFAPRESSRSHNVSRNLFPSHNLPPLPQKPGEVISGSSLDIQAHSLTTPPHSQDMVSASPSKHGFAQQSASSNEGSSSEVDQRSKDVYSLLMSRDKRIKELEHVCNLNTIEFHQISNDLCTQLQSSSSSFPSPHP